MNNSLMIMTGTLRAFDGYDRWEKFPYRTFGSKEELDVLKEELENPMFSKRKYLNLEIREATEQETTQYRNELQAEIVRHEKAYEKLSEKMHSTATLIQEKKEKIKQLEKLKIPY